MTLLVLFPAAARARVVASDLRFVAPYRLDAGVVAADAGGLPGSRSAERRGWRRLRLSRRSERRRRRRAAVVENQRRAADGRRPARRFLGNHRTQQPQVADDFVLDALLHRREEREALLLVLDQWI